MYLFNLPAMQDKLEYMFVVSGWLKNKNNHVTLVVMSSIHKHCYA